MREQTRQILQSSLAVAVLACAAGGCEAGDGEASAVRGWLRGRVTDTDGRPVADVDVVVEDVRVRTDARGRFALQARADREVRIAVESDLYSAAELPISVAAEAGANVEVALKPRRVMKLASAATGGRLQADDGFALQLPADALVDASGAPVQGEVDVRYVIVNRASEVTAAPGRLQAIDRNALEGYGVAEVGFYQNGARLRLGRAMQVEIPLYEGHGLSEGAEVDLYHLTSRDTRWTRGARAQVRANKVVVEGELDAWMGAAAALPAASCMKGKLGVDGRGSAANTTIRAARRRGLSLIQAETAADGSFCLPVTADDDWQVSTFYDDGERSFGLQVELRSDNAAGMCGGSGCKDVGAVALPELR